MYPSVTCAYKEVLFRSKSGNNKKLQEAQHEIGDDTFMTQIHTTRIGLIYLYLIKILRSWRFGVEEVIALGIHANAS